MTRQCIECEGPVHGRSDKVYCSDACAIRRRNRDAYKRRSASHALCDLQAEMAVLKEQGHMRPRAKSLAEMERMSA